MANIFSKLFRNKGESVVGIDIGSSAIKVVQLKRKGEKAVLETYGALALGPYADKEIGQTTELGVTKIVEALNDIMREAKVSSRKNGLAIPFRSTLTSVVDMPDVPEKEMAQMVPIEARKYIPVPIAEVSLDWSVVATEEEDALSGGEQKKPFKTKKVLIVAIHNDVITRFQNIVKEALIETKFFEVEIFSALRSTLPPGEKAPVMVFDMGAAFTKLYIIERGTVRSSHTITKGSQDITQSLATGLDVSIKEAEKLKRGVGLSKTEDGKDVAEMVDFTLSFIFNEASRVLKDYEKKNRKAVKKVMLIGGGSALVGLREYAEAKFDADVVLGDPFARVETPAFAEKALKSAGPDFAVATGLALRYLQELE